MQQLLQRLQHNLLDVLTDVEVVSRGRTGQDFMPLRVELATNVETGKRHLGKHLLRQTIDASQGFDFFLGTVQRRIYPQSTRSDDLQFIGRGLRNHVFPLLNGTARNPQNIGNRLKRFEVLHDIRFKHADNV